MTPPKPGTVWQNQKFHTRYIIKEYTGGLVFYHMEHFTRLYYNDLQSFLTSYKPVEV